MTTTSGSAVWKPLVNSSALNHVEERRGNREAARLDVLGDVAAVLVQQNRAPEHQLQLDRGMIVELPDQQLAAPVVRPAGHRKTDFSSACQERGLSRRSSRVSRCERRRT